MYEHYSEMEGESKVMSCLQEKVKLFLQVQLNSFLSGDHSKYGRFIRDLATHWK